MDSDNLKSRIHTSKTVLKYQKKIDRLGIDNSFDASWFLTIRLVTSTILFLLFLLFADYGYLFSPIAVFVYYYSLEYFCITSRIKKRAKNMEREAITFFDILKLALSSGKDIVSSLKIAVSNVDGEIKREVEYTLKEIKYGKSLEEALDCLRIRIPSDVVSNIFLNIKESAVFGTSVISSLDTQIAFLRDKRITDIKEVINKIPIKISTISVIFFIPILMMLILSPVLIEYFMS